MQKTISQLKNEPGNEFTSKSTDLAKKEVVYLMAPQDFEEDEIDLIQLVIPLIKYKLQIMLVLVLCVAGGVAITWYFGKTIFSNTLIYRYNGDAPAQFLPERDFFNIDELSSSRNLLQSYYDIPDEVTDYQFLSELKKGYKDMIVFKESEFLENAFSLMVKTDDPVKTNNLLKEIIDYSAIRNREKIKKRTEIQLDEILRSKKELVESLFSAINDLDEIKYIKIADLDYIYGSTLNFLYIFENISGKRKVIKIDSTPLGRLMLDQNLQSMMESIKTSKTLSEELRSNHELQIQQAERLIQLESDYTTKHKIINFLERGVLKGINYQESTEYSKEIVVLEEDLGKHANEISKIRTVLSRTNNTILNNVKLLKEYLYFKNKLENLPKNGWISFNYSNLNEKDSTNIGFIEQEIEKITIPYIEGFISSLNSINSSIVSIKVTNNLNESDFLKYLEVIEWPSNKTIKKDFSIGLTRKKEIDKESEGAANSKIIKSEDVKPLLITRKMLAIVVIFSIFLATCSVFIRTFIENSKKERGLASTNKQDFINALKFWRL